jgi:hypothetical protein
MLAIAARKQSAASLHIVTFARRGEKRLPERVKIPLQASQLNQILSMKSMLDIWLSCAVTCKGTVNGVSGVFSPFDCFACLAAHRIKHPGQATDLFFTLIELARNNRVFAALLRVEPNEELHVVARLGFDHTRT